MAPLRAKVVTERIQSSEAGPQSCIASDAEGENEMESLIRRLFDSLWQRRMENLSDFYDFRVTAHLPKCREIYGTRECLEVCRGAVRHTS